MKKNKVAASIELAGAMRDMANISSINKKKAEQKQEARDGAVDRVFDAVEGLPTQDVLNVLTGALMAAIDTLPSDSARQVKDQIIEAMKPKEYNY